MKSIQPAIKHSHDGEIMFHKDPMIFLQEKELLIQVGNGLFVIQGILVDILEKIENTVKGIAQKVNAYEVIVPFLLSSENLEASCYLESFRHQALMIKSLNKNINKYSAHGEFIGMCSPTVCYHYFSALKDKTVNHNYAITALAQCARKEEGDLRDLSRLTNFTMREVVFFGTKEFCLEKRLNIISETMRIFDEVFDLTYSIITAFDPFFGQASEVKKQAQLLAGSKHEMRAVLPYSGETSSIASFNYHGSVFYDRFDIHSASENVSYSGCVGWGYERILYAILSQKGVDFGSAYYKKLLK